MSGVWRGGGQGGGQGEVAHLQAGAVLGTLQKSKLRQVSYRNISHTVLWEIG